MSSRELRHLALYFFFLSVFCGLTSNPYWRSSKSFHFFFSSKLTTPWEDTEVAINKAAFKFCPLPCYMWTARAWAVAFRTDHTLGPVGVFWSAAAEGTALVSAHFPSLCACYQVTLFEHETLTSSYTTYFRRCSHPSCDRYCTLGWSNITCF